MAITPARLPRQRRAAPPPVVDFHVSEIAADQAGSLSPFGPDVEFPLPLSRLRYTHPSAAERPNLAEGR